MMTKNEKLKQANIDKISLFLNKKYKKVFKDKQFTMEILKQEVSRLLLGKDMKTFNFNESIKKIEKEILKKVSNFGEIKYEPVQMAKINDLLYYKSNQLQENKQNTKKENIPRPNNLKIKAPKSENDRVNKLNSQKRVQSALPNNQNMNLNIKNNSKGKKNNEIPYPTEKMEKLKEREKNKWAIQINKEHEQYLKEQEQLKKTIYEKKLRQREILEKQIKEKKDKAQRIREEEKRQPSLTSLNFGNNDININNNLINKQIEKPKRPLSSNPLISRKKEEINYQKKIEEDLKKYEEEEKIKRKALREKYKEIEKENYENALKKKQKKEYEKELEKNEKNDLNMFNEEANRTLQLMKMKQKNAEDLNRINQNMKHQIAINNYEELKYKREREQEQKKINDEELLLKERKQKMINDYRKGLDEQVKEKQMLKEINNKVKFDENKDCLNIKNQLQEEQNNRNKEKYEKINNYKKELDEQIEKNKKFKQNKELLE